MSKQMTEMLARGDCVLSPARSSQAIVIEFAVVSLVFVERLLP